MTHSILARLFKPLRRFARRLRDDQRGNFLMMMGFALVPLTFAIGFGLDYSRAQTLQTQLNAAADAAALAAVDPAMLCQTSATAQAAAVATFQAQASTLRGIASYTSGYNPQVTITPASTAAGCNGTLRTATVTYKAQAQNQFGSVLGVTTLPIGGSVTADASQPPSINFYIAMDTSPSMLLPTTSAGITNLNNGTIWNGAGAFGWPVVGCDFACHSDNAHTWNYGNFIKDANGYALYTTTFDPASVTASNTYRINCANGYVYNGTGTQIGTSGSITNSGGVTACGGNYWNNNGGNVVYNAVNLQYKATGQSYYTSVTVNIPDSWWLARNYGSLNPGQSQIQLRIDAEGLAAQNLVTYAYNIEQEFASSGSPPAYQLQFFTFNIGAPQPISTSPFGTMTDVATSHSSTFPDMGAQAPLMEGIGCWTNACYSADAFTDFTATLNGMAAVMPSSAGLGTKASPQNVLVLITDGAGDDFTGDGMGQMSATQIANCTAIKATGTKIAILYTQYMPATINYTANPTFNNFANNNVPYIQQQLQACATQNANGTYLMETVPTDGDISAALNQLFSMVVQSARLIQ